LDENLRVLAVSQSFYNVFKIKPEETIRELIYDLGNKQWDIQKLREFLETILPDKTTFFSLPCSRVGVYISYLNTTNTINKLRL